MSAANEDSAFRALRERVFEGLLKEPYPDHIYGVGFLRGLSDLGRPGSTPNAPVDDPPETFIMWIVSQGVRACTTSELKGFETGACTTSLGQPAVKLHVGIKIESPSTAVVETFFYLGMLAASWSQARWVCLDDGWREAEILSAWEA